MHIVTSLPPFSLVEKWRRRHLGGAKAGDVISHVVHGRLHTCFAVLPPSIGPSMSGRYANWGRNVTQTGVGILLPGPMEGGSTAKQVWPTPEITSPAFSPPPVSAPVNSPRNGSVPPVSRMTWKDEQHGYIYAQGPGECVVRLNIQGSHAVLKSLGNSGIWKRKIRLLKSLKMSGIWGPGS